MQTGLALVTINAPRRRVDVALPQHIPLVDLLPDVLQHAGDGLADDGESHGGWVLRRTGGAVLAGAQTLQSQGVRDGEVLHLVPARERWPELEFDDVVEAIAAGARRRGAAWSGVQTGAATLAAAGVVLTVALAALLRAGPGSRAAPLVVLAVAACLTLGGALASRVYDRRAAGVALGAFALPYAFAAGALFAAGDPVVPAAGVRWLGAPELLLGSAALTLLGVLGLVGVGAGRAIFAASVLVGLLGCLAALTGLVLPAPEAAAILASALVCGVGLLPLLAIRLGRLPMPPVTMPAGDKAGEPDRDRVFAAVARADELLGGMLIGHAVLTTVAAIVLVVDGGVAGKVLAGVSGVALLLRSRVFVTVRQRVPLVVGGLAALAALGSALAVRPDGPSPVALAGLGLAIALTLTAAGATYSHKPAGPYLGRAADLLDTALVVAVVPIACAVLGLYARAGALID